MDHPVPIDACAARNDVGNWVAACKSCNSRCGALYLAAKRKGLPETPARADWEALHRVVPVGSARRRARRFL